MRKIFEIREDGAWGPNDHGYVVGYIRANSKEELKKKFNNGSLEFFELTIKQYLEKVAYAKASLKILDLNWYERNHKKQ